MNTKTLTAGLMAAALAASSAAPAHADNAGAVILGGILGLGVGAAIASEHHPHVCCYRQPYYGPRPGYIVGPQPYAPPPPVGYIPCVVRRTVWDPYYGGYVVRRVTVPC